MKLQLIRHNVASDDAPPNLIERQLQPLRASLRIDEARVRLDRHPERSPSFSVRIHLVTPGPDVVASGRDHTLRAALHKVMANLESQLWERTRMRLRKTGSGLAGLGRGQMCSRP